MRAFELVEGYNEQIVSDLGDLLAVARSRDLQSIPTKALVAELQAMGHNVNLNSIMTILSGNEFVQTATPETVMLKQDDVAGQSGDAEAAEQNAQHVDDMATDTAQAGIQQDITQ